MFFDSMYLLFMLPAMLFAGWAQWRVKSAFHQGSLERAACGLSGAEVAQRILDANSIDDVGIERAHGYLGDHYDPKSKMLRLSEDVYSGRSLSSLGVAAHEVGHAIQDAKRYGPLTVRNAIVPIASIGSNLSWGIMFVGMLLSSMNIIVIGIAAFSLMVVFQLVNLPVEFDASRRARAILLGRGIVSSEEDRVVGKVLNAAAMTYVAATISSVLTLFYYLMRFGLIGGRDR
jgi:Zn-dependent membrane protease YugP